MKKIIALILMIAVCFSAAACADSEPSGDLKIAVTCFAAYDWTREVVGDTPADIFFVGGGADLHSYDPSAEDIMNVSTCDLLISVGGESDSWISEIELKDGAMSINMLDVLSDRLYYVHDHGTETDVADEHVWMSIDNAHIISKSISDALSELCPDNALAYDDNRERLALELNAIDAQYLGAVNGFEMPAVVVADRFAFAYLCIDYGIGWYSAFSSCSSDSNASFETVTRLAQVIDTYSVPAIAVTETGNPIAQTVIDSSRDKSCNTVTLDSMQSATADDSYVEIMKKNVTALSELLFEEH